MTQSLGDRMKANYEDRARFYLTRRVPVIVRVDGKAFHTLTRKFEKPFDSTFIAAMLASATQTGAEMSGCRAIYVQSDEASFLLTDYEGLDTQAWFDYNKSKIESVTASMMTAHFGFILEALCPKHAPAYFDARAFNIPREEVVNYFLWRARDWARNSLSMYCQAFFSHKNLLGANAEQQHEMLHGIGKNWADLSSTLKNGTLVVRGSKGFSGTSNVLPNFASIDALLHDVIYPPEVEQ